MRIDADGKINFLTPTNISSGGGSSYVPFCVNSGPIVDGEEALLSISGNTITATAPFTLTSAEGETRTVNSDRQLDVSTLQDGDYTILYNFETDALEAFGNTIFTDKKFPDEAVVGDMLFNISVVPYKCEIKTESGTETKQYSRIGLYTRVSGGGNSLTTGIYNQNGVNTNNMSDIGDPILSLNGELYPDCIWVDKTGVTLNPSSYPKLFEKYGTKFGGDGVTSFGLPDFSDCAIWAHSTAGQRLTAALPNITASASFQCKDNAGADTYGTSGAFYIGSTNGKRRTGGSSSSGDCHALGLDASRSSSVYKSGTTTVYPNRMTVRVMTRYK